MVVVTVPHSKPPKEETGAVEFATVLSKLSPDFTILYGYNHIDIVNVETAQGKDSNYARDFYEQITESKFHLNIRSFEADNEDLKDSDVMLAFLPSVSNESLYERLRNMLDNYGIISIMEVPYTNHRLSLVSETLFDTPSITIYVNEGAVDLYEVFAEQVASFVEQFVTVEAQTVS